MLRSWADDAAAEWLGACLEVFGGEPQQLGHQKQHRQQEQQKEEPRQQEELLHGRNAAVRKAAAPEAAGGSGTVRTRKSSQRR
jgi:hypothetical protein